jgi:hypothetical protein
MKTVTLKLADFLREARVVAAEEGRSISALLTDHLEAIVRERKAFDKAQGEVTINGVSVKVTQIAFDESVSRTVHTTGTCASRGVNPTTNTSDGIFADSLSSELVTPAGDPATGYAATLQVGVAV